MPRRRRLPPETGVFALLGATAFALHALVAAYPRMLAPIVPLLVWLTILALIITQVLRATRRLPVHGLCNRPFALTALMSVVALIATGLTVDLRFFDFPNIVVMMLAGAAIGRAAQVDELDFPPGLDRSSTPVPPSFTPVP